MSLPDKFGHYEVHSELGRGGMAVVYKCWEESLHRFVAIKVLTSHLAQEKDVKERFFREAKSMAAISHPNVINVHFIGEEKGQPYFAMEYIEGKTLAELLSNHSVLNIEHAKNILHQACEGLLAAHESGLIHRDIKPGNMIIADNGFLKLLDFGIAQSHQFDKNLTQTGEVIGTPGYLSPEICTGQIVDKRSDIYSLGIVFYQMLAGDVPFDTSTPYKLLKDIVESDVSGIQEVNKEVDDSTATILMKMIEKNPELRYQNCQEILDALGKIEKNASIDTILQYSKTNQLAEKTSRISYQLTQISHPTKIRKRKNGNTLRLVVISLLALTVVATLYFRYKTPAINYQTSNNGLSILNNNEDLPNDSLANSEKDNSDHKKPDEKGQEIPETPITNIEDLVFIPNSCLEVGPVTVLDQKTSKWPAKKEQAPEDDFLENIRQYLIQSLSENKSLQGSFSDFQPLCEGNTQSYRLSVLVSDYKKGSKNRLFSRIGIGKEKVTLILTLRDLANNLPLANKEIETRDISGQIQSEDNGSEFVDSAVLFLQEAIQSTSSSKEDNKEINLTSSY